MVNTALSHRSLIVSSKYVLKNGRRTPTTNGRRHPRTPCGNVNAKFSWRFSRTGSGKSRIYGKIETRGGCRLSACCSPCPISQSRAGGRCSLENALLLEGPKNKRMIATEHPIVTIAIAMASGAQNGAKTQSHGQAICPVSFRATNRSPSRVKSPILILIMLY